MRWRSPTQLHDSFALSNVVGACALGGSFCQRNRTEVSSARCPRRTASMRPGSANEQKKGNGLASPYSSPINNRGVAGDSSKSAAANRCWAGDKELARRSPRRAIADLIVVLHAEHKFRAAPCPHDCHDDVDGMGYTGRRKRKHLATPWQAAGLTKLCIVSVALAREQRMDAMVKIVAPNTIESISTFAARVTRRTSFWFVSAITTTRRPCRLATLCTVSSHFRQICSAPVS